VLRLRVVADPEGSVRFVRVVSIGCCPPPPGSNGCVTERRLSSGMTPPAGPLPSPGRGARMPRPQAHSAERNTRGGGAPRWWTDDDESYGMPDVQTICTTMHSAAPIFCNCTGNGGRSAKAEIPPLSRPNADTNTETRAKHGRYTSPAGRGFRGHACALVQEGGRPCRRAH